MAFDTVTTGEIIAGVGAAGGGVGLWRMVTFMLDKIKVVETEQHRCQRQITADVSEIKQILLAGKESRITGEKKLDELSKAINEVKVTLAKVQQKALNGEV